MINLNYIAPLNQLGYGQTSKNFAISMLKAGVDLSIFPISEISIEHEAYMKLQRFIPKISQKKIDKNANCLKIWHQNDLYEFVGKGKHIGFPIFELDRFTEAEKHSLNHCDEIVVCSEWAAGIVRNSGIARPVKVVPLGYDPNIFRPAPILKGSTKFFNCGKWELRKGHDFILECFNKAFTMKDDVQLIMMCDNPFLPEQTKEWMKLYKNSNMGGKITFVPRQESHENVYYIMKQVDCGLFPARAEGWNLELLEVLACGKHAITTNYSGHTEFCKEGCHLIDIDSLEVAKDNIWFHGDGLWAKLGEAQLDQTVEYMRTIHDLKKSGNLSPNTAGITQASDFTWDKSTNKLIEVIT